MKKFIYSILFLFVSLVSWAQPEKPVIEEVNGKKYYVHIVQGGNTLYGLTKLYQTSAEQIIAENPSAANGLQIGQKIMIPVDQVPTTPPVQKAPATHTVQKSETLYGISRKYSVTMEDMVKLNPGTENGISIGQVLQIPGNGTLPQEEDLQKQKMQVTFSDSLVMYTVLPHETLYSISKRFMVPVEELQSLNSLRNNRIRKGDVLKIPMKKENIKKIEVRKINSDPVNKVDEELTFRSKNQYTIVYLLPFNLDGNSDQLRSISTEFYMGAKIAIDSLENMGLNAKIHFIDASTDTLKFKAQLESKEVKKADLLIGPLNGKTVEIAANWCKQNGVRMVSPFYSSPGLLRDNRYLYNAVNSDITLIEGLASYTAKNRRDDQILLIKVDAQDNELYQAFRQKFLSESNGKKIIETTQADMANYFRKGGNTILVVPSRDKGFSTKFMNQLNQVASKAGSGNISVFCTKDWLNNDDIKGFYKNKYSFHVASPYDFNYSYDATKRLLRKYRVNYNADLSRYGTQGFDLSMYFIQEFFLKKPQTDGVMNKINMQNISSGSGYENKTCFILKQEEYESKQMGIINE